MEQIHLHPGANCAYVYLLYVSIGDFDILQTFSVYVFVFKRYKKINFKLFYQNEKADCLSWLTRYQNKCAYINASTILIILKQA